MNKTTRTIIITVALIGLVLAVARTLRVKESQPNNSQPPPINNSSEQEEIKSEESHPMAIEVLRQREFPGGDFVIERTLPNGTNYRQFIASYQSEGLKIYGLLTVPLAPKPEKGYPAVVFVHGHIPPKQYSTTGSYPTYQAALARGGFITFKPDLRGHGQSEGEAVGAHFSEKYLVDTLYAIAYLKKYKDVDSERIGYWGHSNGGKIGLRTLVISSDIKAAVFWAGVIGSFEDMLETYNEKISFLRDRNSSLVEENGLPSQNPEFWKKIDPYSYLDNIKAPIQLHHGSNDDSVPVELSLRLKGELEKLGKPVEYFEYPGDDHNIGKSSGTAWQRTIDFFNKNL